MLLGSAPWAAADEADELAAQIDSRLQTLWDAAGVAPAPLSSDAEFLRRVWLDLAGRIPTAGQAREFLADPRSDKRQRLVEELLASGAFVGHFTRTWREAWLPKQDSERFPAYAQRFDEFLRDRFRRGTPYDVVVREILTSPLEGTLVAADDSGWHTSLGFFEANERRAENIATAAARDFLGLRIDCAQCHDHPFGVWKRDQFWRLAAFFSSERTDEQPSIVIPGLETVVTAQFLGGDSPAWSPEQLTDERATREVLSRWIVSPENPYFARAAVNRLWAHCFGAGLVEPVDDISAVPLADHPELLNDLAAAFVAQGFDLKFVLRGILRSQAYGRTSRRSDPSQDDPQFFARMHVKNMTAQQLYDSLLRAAGYDGDGPHAGTADDAALQSEFLARFASSERAIDATATIPQALTRMNGKLSTLAADAATSPLLQGLQSATFLSPEAQVEALFLATLSRPPTPEESLRLTSYVVAGGASESSTDALEDIFWALVNSSEFATNH